MSCPPQPLRLEPWHLVAAPPRPACFETAGKRDKIAIPIYRSRSRLGTSRERRCPMTKWLAALISFACLLGAAAAQTPIYPAKTITIVVTAAAGGVSDLVARAIGQRLSELWGQQG